MAGIKIYVFHYKPGQVVSPSASYVNIWAGKNMSVEDSCLTGDDSGDNISAKNKYYSELTGLYWIWKNTSDEITGTCHYRRFFTATKEPLLYKLKRLLYYPAGLWKKRYGLIYTSNYKYWRSHILQTEQAEKYLNEYDAILPVSRILKYSVEEHYRRYHNQDDLKMLEKILLSSYPEYHEAFQKVLKGKRLFANNIFILKRDKFNDLCAWLFDILFRFEAEADLSNYQDYQERIFGFLSERLITVWVTFHQLNYKELPLLYFKKLKSGK